MSSGRTLPTGLATALAAAEIAPVFLVELQWLSGTVYAWNGYHVLSWNSISWQPTGHLGTIAEIKESSDGSATGVQLVLAGIPSALVAQALENGSQCRPARIYFGVINAAGFTIDPYLIFDGLIDYASITTNGETSTIAVALEKELIDSRSDARRYTHEDQQVEFPGDLGFDFVAALANKTFTWGKATVYPSGGGGGVGVTPDPNEP